MSGLDVLRKSDAGIYLINDKVLVGPIHGWKRIPNYYKRNKELYGALDVIKWDGKEVMEYLKLEDIK